MSTRGRVRRRPGGRWMVVLAAFSALCTLPMTYGGPVFAAARRVAVVTPATELGDQVVKVTWSGFDPTRADGNYGVVVLQCRAQPKSVVNDCNTGATYPYSLTGNQQQGVTARNGTGSVFVDVMTTARLPSLACSESTPCSLMLYETTPDGFDPNGLPSDRVLVPLRFKRNSADCPPVQSYDFTFEAEASAAPALYQWAAAVCTGAHRYTVGITNTSSNEARSDFFSGTVDMGVTSVAPGAGETNKQSRKFSVAPLDLTAVVFAYNITDSKTHKPITDLTLTPRLAARLLSDSDVGTLFSDPEFLALNPHHSWPIQAADPGLRAEKNADTWLVTNWINGNRAARAFLNGHDRYHVPVNPAWRGVHYPTDVFEARNPNGVYLPRIGEDGVADRIFADTKPADSVQTDPLDAGFIGVLDLPTALRYKLPIANLTDGVKKPVASLLTGAAAGFDAMQTSASGFHQEPAAVTDPAAYPLLKVDSAMVPPTLDKSPKDQRIRAFLDYAVTDGRQNMPAGYLSLPASLQLQTLQYTGDEFLADTPTTTTTTTQPADLNGGNGGSYNGDGYTGAGAYPGTGGLSGNGTTTPTASPTGSTGSKGGKVTTTTKPHVAKLAALHVPDSKDYLLLPIALALIGVAAFARGAEYAGRRVRLRRKPQ